MSQRDPSVAISQIQYQKVSEEAKERGISVKRHFNNIIDYYTKRRDMIDDYSDSLQYVGIAADIMTIRDMELNKTIDIHYKSGSLFCDECNTNYCKHTFFAILIPEVTKLIK